jgi:hypothetical protein
MTTAAHAPRIGAHVLIVLIVSLEIIKATTATGSHMMPRLQHDFGGPRGSTKTEVNDCLSALPVEFPVPSVRVWRS